MEKRRLLKSYWWNYKFVWPFWGDHLAVELFVLIHSGGPKLQIVLNPVYILCFSLYIHTFSLKGNTSQLFFGIFKVPASLFLHFGAFIKELRVTWIQALWYYSGSDNWDSCRVTNGQEIHSMDMLDWGRGRVLGGMEQKGTGGDFFMWHRMAWNLKLINYFWIFLFNIFGPWLTMSNWNSGKQNRG